MNRIILMEEIIEMYNRFLFIRSDNILESHSKIIEWFSESEGISRRLGNRIVQIGRLNSNQEY